MLDPPLPGVRQRVVSVPDLHGSTWEMGVINRNGEWSAFASVHGESSPVATLSVNALESIQRFLADPARPREWREAPGLSVTRAEDDTVSFAITAGGRTESTSRWDREVADVVTALLNRVAEG